MTAIATPAKPPTPAKTRTADTARPKPRPAHKTAPVEPMTALGAPAIVFPHLTPTTLLSEPANTANLHPSEPTNVPTAKIVLEDGSDLLNPLYVLTLFAS